jgi:cell division protein FtsA
MAKRDEIVVGLDVGTSKVAVVVGEAKASGELDVIGVGTADSRGIKKGVVVNVAETIDAIRKAVHEAELMAGCTVNAVHIGLSGAHLKSFNNRGVVAVQGDHVGQADVDRVIENARAVQIPPDRQIVHTVPQEFLVDENDGIKQPVGIAGGRLQANVHIITAVASSAQNISQCAERAGLHVLKVHANLLAAASAVLEADERELGVVLVDIGGGTTDIAVFHNGALVHSAVLGVGGEHVTNDIAVGLRTPRAEAERIKLKHGAALSSLVDEGEAIEVACVGGRDPVERKRSLLCDIIEPRMEEVFGLVEQEIQASNFADVLGSGVVLTGGSAQLPGIAELGEEVLNLPVRIGRPRPVGGLYDLVKSPNYAAAVGLVMLASSADSAHTRDLLRRTRPGLNGRSPKLLTKIRDWLADAFQ